MILGLAIDHRDSMRAALESAGLDAGSGEVIATIKADVCRAVGPLATAIMIDAEFGRIALEEGAVPASCALVMPLEEQGTTTGAAPLTRLMASFDPRTAARAFGADAVKLLLPFRADGSTAAAQLATARRAVALAHAEGLPLVLEPVVYREPAASEDSHWAAYTDLVVRSVARLAELAPDLLKLPFPARTAGAPGAAAACRAMHDACSGVPWVLLGGGVAQEEMEARLQLACAAGAVGFMVGRTLWSTALVADAAQRRDGIARRVVPAFERLAAIASGATSGSPRERPGSRPAC